MENVSSKLYKQHLTDAEKLAAAKRKKEEAIQRNIKEGGTRKQATEQYLRNI